MFINCLKNKKGASEVELPNRQLAISNRPSISKFEEQKVHSFFRGKILGADLADMQLISKYGKRFRFLLYVIDIFSKYAWVVPLKDKKTNAVTNAFQNVLNKSRCKPNKKVDKFTDFYNI